MEQTSKHRCFGDPTDSLMARYHDEEWGIPVHEDQKLFEFLLLESAQAGLSWKTILHKRENYRRAFDKFDPKLVASYGADQEARLLADPGIVRNRLKITSAINNAKRFLEIQREFKSFNNYIWDFTEFKNYPVAPRRTSGPVPTQTRESQSMSRDLKKRGFKFVGPVICYSFMQAIGIVNDHTRDCFLSPEPP